jgi:K+-sensing histidine kinase KdpD
MSDLIPGIAVAADLFPNAAESSLTALREMAMRAATGRVDAQLR